MTSVGLSCLLCQIHTITLNFSLKADAGFLFKLPFHLKQHSSYTLVPVRASEGGTGNENKKLISVSSNLIPLYETQ